MNHNKSKLRAYVDRDRDYRLMGLGKTLFFTFSAVFLCLLAVQWFTGDAFFAPSNLSKPNAFFPHYNVSIPDFAKAAIGFAVGGLGFAGLQERRKREITELFYKITEEMDAQQQSKVD